MATIHRQVSIAAPPDDVWDAVRDVGALHTRLVPGFVLDTRLEPGARVVTFFNGTVVRELIVAIDQERRRLVWSAVDGHSTHHNASAQVLDDERGGTLFVWIADVLPDPVAAPMGALMDRGIAVIKETMEQAQ
jgi:carbon monoxide dehydrogenase subunit G